MTVVTEEVDAFLSMFPDRATGKAQRDARRQTRAKKERRSQLSPQQRKRGGVRTSQINYRCTPDHQKLSKAVADKLGCSVADAMEEALALFAAQHNVEVKA